MSVNLLNAPDSEGSWGSVFALLGRANSALNHDFCPNANRWVYWLKNPFWILILAIVLSLICGIFLSPSALFITGILTVLAGIGICLPWLAIRGVRAKVTFDVRRSRVGQPVLVRLRVRNRWPIPVWGLSLVRGFAVDTSSDSSEGVALAKVGPWSTVEFTWAFTPQMRGAYPLMEPEVETAFPFGLYRASRSVAVEGSLIVWPATVTLEGLPDTPDFSQSDDQLADRRVGDFGDVLGTRAFRQGDSLRRIHWAQSVRHQKLIVCERQAPATCAVTVAVDTAEGSHPGHASVKSRRIDDSFELLISTAASICESLHRQHCIVTLAICDQRIVAGESTVSFSRLMDALAQAKPSSDTVPLQRVTVLGGFGIAVTTSFGQQASGAKLNAWNVVTVDATPKESRASGVAGGNTRTTGGRLPWIAVRGLSGLQSVLPQTWKGACDAR
ncbi:MAG: DUF58 domain-containing protein [Planctomycetota bacterium]